MTEETEVATADNVVAIRPMDQDILDSLEAAGVDVTRVVDASKIDLPEPVYGEIFIRHCEPDEQALFVELYEVKEQLEDQSRSLMGSAVSGLGAEIRDSDRSKPVTDIMNDAHKHFDFVDDETEEAFCRLYQRSNYLHTSLHWILGERCGAHTWRLGIRKPSKGSDMLRIVKMVKRSDGTPAHAQ